MDEILIGLAVGVTEGFVETFIPGTEKLIQKGNESVKDAAAAGYMAGEFSRALTKTILNSILL